MSYTLFSVENVNDFKEMPAMWQNFINDLSSQHSDWDIMNSNDSDKIIADQLSVVWFAEFKEYYSEEHDFPVKYELVFKDEKSASWFALRWA